MFGRSSGKLKATAAAIYEKPPEIAAGFSAEDYETEPVEVWPECWPVVDLFIKLGTQWNAGMNGTQGLNYLVLFSFLDRITSSKEEWAQMFDDIRVMELAALEEMKKG